MWLPNRRSLLLAACLTCVITGAAAQPAAQGLIVRLKGAAAQQAQPHADEGRWQRVVRDSGLTGSSGRREPARRAVGRDQQLLDFGRPLSPSEAEQLAARLRRRADVDWVEPNVRERPAQVGVPNDPMYAQQWWLQPAGGTNSDAASKRRRGVPGFETAWRAGITAGVPVAVLDTGTTAHPDLEGRVLPGYDFVSSPLYANDGGGRDADPSDPGDWVSDEDAALPDFSGCRVETSSWHGTLVAGLLAASGGNGSGVAGSIWNASVLPVRVSGKCGASVTDIVDGMRWAAGLQVAGAPQNPNPVRVVNISFGGPAACGPAYQSAVDELHAHGVVVVAAAGNDAGAPSRPASCKGVVGVVALNRDGFKTTYSNFGSGLAASGVATVGGDDGDGRWGGLLADGGLISIWNDGTRGPGAPRYAGLFGTSFATPLVSATMAMMLALNPALSADQLVAGVRLSSRPHVVSPHIGLCSAANPGRCICDADTCGAGILDVEQALRYARDPAGYVAPDRAPAIIDNADVTLAASMGRDRPAAVMTAAAADTPSGTSVGTGGGALGASWLLALAGALLVLVTAAPGTARTRR